MHHILITLVAGVIAVLGALAPPAATAAPFAAYVMDARTGKEIYSQNADARLHPASLTKMMTLYMAFTAVERGQVRLDSRFTVSSHAASQPPSRLGLRPGQKIELRYLIRAAAVKSANDAATVIGEGLAGSESQFGAQMTAMARALGMRNSAFRNANGLTASGHYSSARDMTILGRRLFYDFPQYYSIFSRRSADAGIATVSSTNKRFLDNYKGADGIKTGYTRAAGFNLTASAQRGPKRIIATVLGGQSTAQRNAVMTQLLDAGFGSAPTRVREIRPDAPAYLVEKKRSVKVARAEAPPVAPVKLKTVAVRKAAPASAVPALPPVPRGDRLAAAVAEAQAAPQPVPEPAPEPVTARDTPAPRLTASARPAPRPGRASAPARAQEPVAVAVATTPPVAPERPSRAPRGNAPEVAVKTPGSAIPAKADVRTRSTRLAESAAPRPKSDTVILAAMDEEGDRSEPEATEIVSRPSSKGSRHYGVSLGHYRSKHEAEQLLLRTALQEASVLDEARRHVDNTKRGFEAQFTGMTQASATLVCGKLASNAQACTVTGP